MSCLECKGSIKNFILKIFSKKHRKACEATLRDTIEDLIEEDECSETQSIAEDEREMLENVLNLRDIQVQDIMIPRVEIKSVSTTTKIEDLMSEFVEAQKSSIIIYQGTIDHVAGVIYLKDVANWFYMNKPFNVTLFTKEVLFIPPTMRTLDLLLKMKETGLKMAIVVDEYGGVDGLVSFGDLVEEIIGDIQDAAEIKHQKRRILKNSDGSVTVDARVEFEEIEKYGNIKIAPEDKSIDTVGGMIFSLAGKVPVRGELILCPSQNIEFEILEADPRKIKTVRIRKKS